MKSVNFITIKIWISVFCSQIIISKRNTFRAMESIHNVLLCEKMFTFFVITHNDCVYDLLINQTWKYHRSDLVEVKTAAQQVWICLGKNYFNLVPLFDKNADEDDKWIRKYHQKMINYFLFIILGSFAMLRKTSVQFYFKLFRYAYYGSLN